MLEGLTVEARWEEVEESASDLASEWPRENPVTLTARRLLGATQRTSVFEVKDVNDARFVLTIRVQGDKGGSCANAVGVFRGLGLARYCGNPVQLCLPADAGIEAWLSAAVGMRPLDSICLCRKEWRVDVARAVWCCYSAVLQTLHSEEYTLGDLHPGNALVGKDPAEHNMIAVQLIDLETVKKIVPGVNSTVRQVARKSFAPLGKDARGTKMGDWQSLCYVVAWVLDFDGYRNKRLYAKESGANVDDRKKNVLRHIIKNGTAQRVKSPDLLRRFAEVILPAGEAEEHNMGEMWERILSCLSPTTEAENGSGEG
eukprot:TRINITY_DN3736_c0_g1_i4.p1 TRINITY_DN3736_c0_g1~~TRINITY_DN3736_c0_g1_i4.p1  ORF type:complete len:314 (-),score=44.18 TRINITY_DN3736_c0_g1_i4:323-1264(-)